MVFSSIVIYLFGGLTFWPLVAVGVYLWFPPRSSTRSDSVARDVSDEKQHSGPAPRDNRSAYLARLEREGTVFPDLDSDIEASCWIRIASSPVASIDSLEDAEAAASKSDKAVNSARSSLQKFIASTHLFGGHSRFGKSASADADNPAKGANDEHDSPLASSASSVYSGESTMDYTEVRPKSLSKCQRVWAVVRGGQLQLYDSKSELKPPRVVNLPKYVVTLWPQDLQEFELFYKRYPIMLAHRSGNEGVVTLDMSPGVAPRDALYLYVENPVEKEDLYFSLIKESTNTKNLTVDELVEYDQTSLGPRDPEVMARPIRVRKAESQQLQSLIWSTELSSDTQWLNALLGRMFFALKDSEMADNYLRSKFSYKLRPISASSNIIGDIEVRSIQSGSSPPYISSIKLKELTPDGNLVLTAGINYNGGFRVNLGTSVKLAAVTSLTTVQIPIELAATVRRLEGTMVLRIKSAPSERIWYAFESMPDVDLVIEPVVYETQISLSVVTKFIRSKILDSLKDSLVMPYMDDVAFHQTVGSFYRGGIWEPEPSVKAAKAQAAGKSKLSPSKSQPAMSSSVKAPKPGKTSRPSLHSADSSGSVKTMASSAGTVGSAGSGSASTSVRRDAGQALRRKTWMDSSGGEQSSSNEVMKPSEPTPASSISAGPLRQFGNWVGRKRNSGSAKVTTAPTNVPGDTSRDVSETSSVHEGGVGTISTTLQYQTTAAESSSPMDSSGQPLVPRRRRPSDVESLFSLSPRRTSGATTQVTTTNAASTDQSSPTRASSVTSRSTPSVKEPVRRKPVPIATEPSQSSGVPYVNGISSTSTSSAGTPSAGTPTPEIDSIVTSPTGSQVLSRNSQGSNDEPQAPPITPRIRPKQEYAPHATERPASVPFSYSGYGRTVSRQETHDPPSYSSPPHTARTEGDENVSPNSNVNSSGDINSELSGNPSSTGTHTDAMETSLDQVSTSPSVFGPPLPMNTSSPSTNTSTAQTTGVLVNNHSHSGRQRRASSVSSLQSFVNQQDASSIRSNRSKSSKRSTRSRAAGPPLPPRRRTVVLQNVAPEELDD